MDHPYAASPGGSHLLPLARRSLLTGAAAMLGLAPLAVRAEAGVLRVGDQKGGCEAVMKAAGVLGNLPYTLKWSQFSAASPLLEALNADAVDTAYASDAPSTFALAAGTDARVVGAFRSTGSNTAIIVGPNSPITTAAQLKGKRIATNRGSVGHALMLALAEREGWAESDLHFANLLPSDAKAALASGSVDAWSTWDVYIAQAQINDGAKIIVDGSGGLLSGLSFQTATTSAIKNKRAALTDFLHRHAQARRWALTHADDYARVLAAEIGVSEAIAQRTLQFDNIAPVLIDDRVVADEQVTADRYLRAHLLQAHLDAGPIFDRSFNAVVT
jgi:sulfonate transport system substrate-binding protein